MLSGNLEVRSQPESGASMLTSSALRHARAAVQVTEIKITTRYDSFILNADPGSPASAFAEFAACLAQYIPCARPPPPAARTRHSALSCEQLAVRAEGTAALVRITDELLIMLLSPAHCLQVCGSGW